MSKVVVLGSNSFSGSDFIDYLLETGAYEVVGISRSQEKNHIFLPYKNEKNIPFQFVQADMNKDLPRIFQVIDAFQPDFIVNFAAQSEVAPSWEKPEHWFQTNTVALAQLINGLKDRPFLKRYLHISSPEVYGTCVGSVLETAPLNPSTPYAASKAAADLLLSTFVKNFQFPLITVRSTNVYGAHQQLFKIIPRSIIYLKLGRPIPLHGGGNAVKSYIHIRDVSRGELAVLLEGRIGQIYHLSPNQGISVKEVVQKICSIMGRDPASSIQVVGERLGQDAAYLIDSSRARRELNWDTQVSIDGGLNEVVRWVEGNWDLIKDLSLDYVHVP